MTPRATSDAAVPAPRGPRVTPPPLELTTFVGREDELAQLDALLGQVRLLTLTGAGGSGKSRLALELTRRRGASGLGAVSWVELAALDDPALVVRQVADACGVGEEVRGGDPAILADLLGSAPRLVVLDNCEHLVEACAELADGLLRRCPGLSILATSREALGVPGERAWLVPALSLPEPHLPTPGSVEASEAVRLFVERARDVAAGFELTDENAPAVVEICRRLDGIPLAIELAAARVKVLHPEQIRDRLDDAFRLLTTGGRTAVARHRTLEAAMDWSHDLLREEARVLLRRLAVFRGGFPLEGAERVGAGDPVAPEDVLDLVSHLVDRSLVAVREQGGVARYLLLETVRQYGARRLAESGEETEVRRRHAAWMEGLLEEADPHFIGPGRRRWVARLEAELDNLREALAWTREHDPGRHLRLVGTSFWYSTRHWTEALAWHRAALALPAAAPPTLERALLLFGMGALLALQSRPGDARPLLEEALILAESLDHAELRAYVLNYLGMTWAGEADRRGEDYSREAGEWFRAHGDLYGLRLSYLLRANLAAATGELDRAMELARDGVEVARAFGQSRELAVSLQTLAVMHILRGEGKAAESLLLEALEASRRDPLYFFIAMGLQYMGEAQALLDRPGTAARLLGAAEALRERIGAAPFRIEQMRLDALVPSLRSVLGEEGFRDAWAAGRGTTPETVLDEVLGETPPLPHAGPAPGGGATPDVAPPPAPADLRVRALGPLEVQVGERILGPDAWNYARPRDLLVLLLLHPPGLTREQVGEALWPEATPSQLKNSFHVTVHHLRKTLDRPEWIVREGDRYRMAPEVRVEFDVRRFQEGMAEVLGPGGDPLPEAAGELGRLLDLYRGDLLDGDTSGRRLEEAADDLRRLYVRALLARGRILEAAGAHAEAAALYQALTAREALDEEAHRRLMAAWARSGDRPRALQHYQRLAEMLRDELDAEPEAETRALYQEILAGA
ncbi:MAG TPA: BTAD domain-containing putative transcriptional regulator [Longimicrobiales bacterium]|nr:BTAD domain-containing putative transcriptional regulator [Longimicrobiales bacterium]